MDKIQNIQASRGIAALLVVMSHAYGPAIVYFGDNYLKYIGRIGDSGVDVFFVISGFIMSLITIHKISVVNFMGDRIKRIVPLYYIITFLIILSFFLVPSAYSNLKIDNCFYVVKSLLFIPAKNNLGEWLPPLPSGWTLNFEFYFYLIIAITLLFKKSYSSAIICLLFSSVFFIYLLFKLDFPPINNLIFLEFYIGYLMGNYYHNLNKRFNIILPYIIFILIIIILNIYNIKIYFNSDDKYRIIYYGIAAVIFIFIMLILEKEKIILPKFFINLGNISYSLYLTHWLALLFFYKSIVFFDFKPDSNIACILAIIFSLFIANIVYKYIEKPIYHLLHNPS